MNRLTAVIPFVLICVGFVDWPSSQTNSTQVRPRTIITTDPELDDSNSLIATGQTIHALIQVTDNGDPPLTSFQRVIVSVKRP